MNTLGVVPTFARLVPVVRSSAETRNGRSVMLRFFKGQDRTPKPPTVIFVPGFMSNGKGLKAEYLAKHCFDKGYNYICYDPECLGDSPGDMKTLQFKDWFEDCQTAIDTAKTEAPNSGIVLVGSSMGGWISLKTFLENRGLIEGLVLVAPALNFMWNKYLDWYNQMDDEAQKKLERGEPYIFSTEYGEMIIRKEFAEKSRLMELDTSHPIDVDCPIRIIHGVEDDIVPFERSMKLMEVVTSQDVDVNYRKHGKHRLSEDQDLKLIAVTLDALIEQLLIS